ncbi:MAG: zinc-binding dehydrogenase [Thermoanaerobaculum sp.]|nr:zinc-binding dehydrogenase [Thermoanaerobaculum sp.]
MRAWVAPRYGPPEVLRLEEVARPEPGPGQGLVRVRAIGLNFADCMARLGVYPNTPKPPFIPGMEVAGEVAALGDGVSEPSVGSRVGAVPIFSGHAEYVVVRASHLRPLPEGVSFEVGASLVVTGLTADHALSTLGRLRPGERVAVLAAAGGVGTMAVQLALGCGAQVLAVASSEAKRQLVAQLGAQEVVSYQEYPQAVASGVDLVLDSVGGRLFRPGWRGLRRDGRYVLFGFAAAVGPKGVRWTKAAWEVARMGVVLPFLLVQSCRTLTGFNLSLVPQLAPHLHQRYQYLCQELLGGRLRPLIGRVFPFSQLPEAHAHLQGRDSVGKVVVTVP